MIGGGLLRRAWRQARRRLLGRWRAVTRPREVTLHGVRLPIDPDVVSPEVARVIYEGRYEVDEIGVIRRHLRPDDVVLELGGGMGFVSTFCALQQRGGERVHVFEANPRLIGLIERTNALNGINTQVHNALLTDTAGTMDFYVSKHFWSSSTVSFEGATRVSVPAVDAGDLLPRLRPTFLICDIEGGEVDLLPRLPLDSVQRLCLEVHPHKAGAVAVARLIGWLIDQGFVLDLASGPEVLFFERIAG